MNHLIDILQLSTQEIDELVEKIFEGSLPTFIAAFTKRQDLSAHELDEVQQMIDRRVYAAKILQYFGTGGISAFGFFAAGKPQRLK